jgi:hypothetical protein
MERVGLRNFRGVDSAETRSGVEHFPDDKALMGAVRRILQFLFGLQGLALAVTIFAVLAYSRIIVRAQSNPELRPKVLETLTMLGISGVLELVAGIAWWRLRKGRPDGRWWAVAASLFCLPLPLPGIFGFALRHSHHWAVLAPALHVPRQLFEAAIGVAGLAAFLPGGAAPKVAAEAKPERLPGDGTTNYLGYVLQAIAILAFLAASAWGSRWGAAHGIQAPDRSLRLLLIPLALLLEIIGHELGHFAAGTLCGYRLRRFHVGPFVWSIRNGKWRFEFCPQVGLGGSVGMVPLNLTEFRERTIIFLAGGPTASLSMSIVSLAALLTPQAASSRFGWHLLATMAAVSSFSFLMNLIPQRTRLFYSDGAQLYQLLAQGPWRKVHLALGMATTSLLAPIRPRDWNIEVIREAADFLKTGTQGMLLRLMASYCLLDTGRVADAVAESRQAQALFRPQMAPNPADFYAEFVFMNALYARDLAAAEAEWSKLEALTKIEFDGDYWRARSAIFWLRGDLDQARAAWETGNEKAQRLPSCGLYDFTRWHYAELRKALDAGRPIAPEPASIESASGEASAEAGLEALAEALQIK